MPRYRIRFTEKAEAQLRAAIPWWRKHRPEAPGLLGTEMRAMVGALRIAHLIVGGVTDGHSQGRA